MQRINEWSWASDDGKYVITNPPWPVQPSSGAQNAPREQKIFTRPATRNPKQRYIVSLPEAQIRFRKSVEERRTHECEYCDKKFCYQKTLRQHIEAVHLGSKPHICNYCGKRFALRGNLKTHVRTHTNIRPYPCSWCGRRFAHKSNLNAHIKQTHLGLKPFKCSLCGKGFSRKSSVISHSLTHTVPQI
mmetsp:Transcript_37128/g.71976  ORF Transcript_37128/g.71976 Transcript_37128/m.71976 type:complete len:188 (+) Transcript_37128:32-595(+)